MAGGLKDFRDFGLVPADLPEPPEVVRAELPTGHAIGQYLFTAILSLLGVGMAALFGLTSRFPANVLGVLAPLALVGFVIYRGTRNDYRWVELAGRTLRAKHLYTGRVVERDIADVADLLTLVIQVRSLTVRVTERLVGRVRGVMIRFRDGRTPLLVSRADPKMRHAQELVEAVLYRLGQFGGELEAEVIDFEGKPLVRRVYPKALP